MKVVFLFLFSSSCAVYVRIVHTHTRTRSWSWCIIQKGDWRSVGRLSPLDPAAASVCLCVRTTERLIEEDIERATFFLLFSLGTGGRRGNSQKENIT